MGKGVAQLAEALCWFDSHWCHWNYSSFRPHNGSWGESTFNKNEYQGYIVQGKGGRCVGLTILSPLCADCPEI